jgi:hypothetical protein
MTETQKSTSPPSKPPAAAPAAEEAPRVLPSVEEVGAWIEGAELPNLSNLFNLLVLKRFDALVMQIRKEELVPQHWQVISKREIEDPQEFDRLAEVKRLQGRYLDHESGQERIEALRSAWVELAGKRPSLWTVADLLAAMRRIIDQQIEIDYHNLLCAIRDVWRDLTYPHGREQLEVLWALLAFVRGKTKK